MRDRHFPRVCGSCQAPMARQEDNCWRCGTDGATKRPRTWLRVIPGGAPTRAADSPWSAIEASMNVTVRTAVAAHAETDRWTDEGGHA